jgi:hypothetical protein
MNVIQKGRKITCAIIAVLLIFEILIIAFLSASYSAVGRYDLANYRMTQGIFRFLLECLLLFFFYKGYKWAKWLLTILLLITGVYSLLSLFKTFTVVTLLLGIVYSVISLAIIASTSVNEFLLSQKNKPQTHA